MLEPLAASGRLKIPLADYEARLTREIGVIHRVGFSGYFLIVWDFIDFAHRRGIPVGPGRGSAAGSLVAYVLKITDIDPMEHGLIFERFLNEERISPPDIDIDFCENRRAEVIEYVTQKYGRENVAQIITFGTMKAKAVVRDVARVLDLSFADSDRIAKMVPSDLGMTLEKALEDSPALADAYKKEELTRRVIDIGKRLEGHHAACVHPRRRCRDLARAPGHPGPALQIPGHRGRGYAVRHEGRRGDRSAQDGLPRPVDAYSHRPLREDDSTRRPAS